MEVVLSVLGASHGWKQCTYLHVPPDLCEFKATCRTLQLQHLIINSYWAAAVPSSSSSTSSDSGKTRFIFESCTAADQYSYLFLSRHPLLVSLPPGWVVDVEESFVPGRDSTRPEQLRGKTTAQILITFTCQTLI